MEADFDPSRGWHVGVAVEDVITRAKRLHLDGGVLLGDVLPSLFCELTDDELQAFAMDGWALAVAFSEEWRSINESWRSRLARDASWQEFRGAMKDLLAILEGLYNAPLAEVGRRMESRLEGRRVC